MKLFKNIFYTKWKVCRTGWPYRVGYGTYRKYWLTGEITLLDSGLTKEYAKSAADELNTKN